MSRTIALLVLTCVAVTVQGSYFTANRPSKQRDPLNRRQYFLSFENVITNADGSFIPQYGAFTAKDYGYYQFELCVPKSNRRAKIALYKFTAGNGPEKIITLKPKHNPKCYSVILNLAKGDFVYNVVLRGNVPNRHEEFIFTGQLLPNLPVAPRIKFNGAQPAQAAFPFAEAFPNDKDSDSDGSGEDKVPFRGGPFNRNRNNNRRRG